jgi:UPF0716 protein FxsA
MPLLIRLLLLLTIVPLAELTLLLWFADVTDWRLTLALVIGTGLAGAWMLRRQGWRTWQRIQDDLRGGRVPADSLQDGLMIMLAAALLITPGILTDAAGLLLLAPASRSMVKAYLASRFKTKFAFRTFGPNGAAWSAETGDADDEIIDVPSRPAGSAEVDQLPR